MTCVLWCWQLLADENGWVEYSRGSLNGSKYLVIDKSMTFYGAQDLCRKYGGYLAHVNTIREQVFIEDFLLQEMQLDGKSNWSKLRSTLVFFMLFRWHITRSTVSVVRSHWNVDKIVKMCVVTVFVYHDFIAIKARKQRALLSLCLFLSIKCISILPFFVPACKRLCRFMHSRQTNLLWWWKNTCKTYRVGQKSKLLYSFHIFAKYWSIFTIFHQ